MTHVSHHIALTVTEKSKRVQTSAQIIARGENGLLVVDLLEP